MGGSEGARERVSEGGKEGGKEDGTEGVEGSEGGIGERGEGIPPVSSPHRPSYITSFTGSSKANPRCLKKQSVSDQRS